MSVVLRLRDDVSFDVSGGWVELRAHPAELGDAGWTRWRAALGSAEDPSNEIAEYLLSAKPIATPRILAGPEGTLVFVFVLHERGPDAMRARYDRIVRWTGVPVSDEDDLDDDTSSAPMAYAGRSPGTASWGLAVAEIRAFPESGLVVFVAAPSEDLARQALARFKVPEPSIPPPTFEQLQHLAPDGRTAPPGPRFRALIDRLRAAATTTELQIRVKGTIETFVRVAASFENGRELWVVQRHQLPSVEEVVGFLTLLKETGARLDLPRATLRIAKGGVVLADADHLLVHTAWTQAIAEIFGGLGAPAEGMVACTTDWGYVVDPRSLELTKIEGGVPRGAVVLDKIRWGREVLTHHYLASEEGLVRLVEKADVLTALTRSFVASAREHGVVPLSVTRGKAFKNGNVELIYEPTRYDRYVLRLSKDLAGEAPAALLGRLRPAAVPVKKPVVDDTWISESAKSDRSTCRTCGKTIERGTLRRGEPHEYQGSITYRWHHDACVVLGRSEA